MPSNLRDWKIGTTKQEMAGAAVSSQFTKLCRTWQTGGGLWELCIAHCASLCCDARERLSATFSNNFWNKQLICPENNWITL